MRTIGRLLVQKMPAVIILKTFFLRYKYRHVKLETNLKQLESIIKVIYLSFLF